MDDWFNFLYVMGVLNDEDQMGDSRIKDLVYEKDGVRIFNKISSCKCCLREEHNEL